jgi:hypothetical protein
VRALVTAWVLVCLAVGTAAADRHSHKGDDDAADDTEAPWSKGVSKANQTRAFQIFKDGNALFEESKYSDALVQYEKAIKLWDHPSIEYNLAICLFNIRQPLEAWDHLEKALKFGEAPLGKRVFGEAMTYQTLLESSLAQLYVTTDQEGVEIELDGRELMTGPGEKTVHLLAGSHQLVASLDGYKTDSRALDLPAGKMTKLEPIALEEDKVEVRVKVKRENYERRWSWWVPWAVMGGSVAVALAGTGVYLDARSSVNDYDAQLAKMCPSGCRPQDIPPALTQKEQSAETEGNIGIGLWSAAVVVGVSAGAMAIINRPKLVTERRPPSVVVAPMLGRGLAGIGVGIALP